MENLGNSVSRGQRFTSGRVSDSTLQDALQTGKTFSVIRMSYFAINYFHSIVGYQNPCPTSLPYNVLEDIKRILVYSATKKSPVTVSPLYEMCNYSGTRTISLSNLRTILIYYLLWVFYSLVKL